MAEAGPPFALYEPSADEIHSAAADIERHAGDVENLNSATAGAQNQAVVSVAGLLELPMMATLDNAKAAASSVLQSCVVAGAACRRWGMHVAYYNSRIEDLNQRWETEAANDFGAERIDLPTGAVPEDQAAAADAFTTEREENKAALESELRMLQQQYETELETGATDVAGALEPGAASNGTLQSLYEGGALSAAMAPAFPQVDYVTGTNPRARWMNLVAGGAIPQELWDMSADEITQYLVDHEDSQWWQIGLGDPATGTRTEDIVAAFGLLLGLDPLQEQERVFLEALGAYDARAAAGFVAEPTPGAGSLDRLDQSTARLREINNRLAAGGRLTAGDKRYMHAWYNHVGADNLGALSDHVSLAIHNESLGVPQADEDEYIARLRSRYLGPVADGVMNLSNPDVGGTDGLSEMPQAVQDLATTQVGHVGDMAWEWRRTWITTDHPTDPNPTREVMVIPGLDRLVGFADLMNESTVLGGDRFTAELGAEALRRKQELNQIAALWTRGEDREWIIPDPEQELTALLSRGDEGVSTMLSVVGRNSDASAALLLNPDERVDVLGESWADVDIDSLPMLLGGGWSDDRGAGDVILAGTDRGIDDRLNPGQGGTELQAHAALAVFREVASDRDGYLARMPETIQNAVVDVGINWIDTFTREFDGDSRVGEFQLPGYAGEVVGIQLDQDTHRSFLEFVAGTDGTTAGSGGLRAYDRFGLAVQMHSAKWVSHALAAGGKENVHDALRAAARLDGSNTAANVEYLMDQGHERELAAQAVSSRKTNWTFIFTNMTMATAAGLGFGWVLTWKNELSKLLGSLVVTDALAAGYAWSADTVGSEPPPDDLIGELNRQAGYVFEDNAHAAVGSTSHTLLTAAGMQGIDPTDGMRDDNAIDRVQSLYETDESGHIVRGTDGEMVLRNYHDVFSESGQENARHMQTAVEAAFMQRDIDDPLGVYDDTWNRYNEIAYYDRTPRQNSQWMHDDDARRLLYGDIDEDHLRYPRAPQDMFTADPRELNTRYQR